jgi:tetratricopeptide (TPR) repeat protein
MKRFALLVLVIFLVLPAPSRGASPEAIDSLVLKIETWDVETGWRDAQQALLQEPKDPRLLELAAQIAFYKGDYEGALRLIRSAVEQSPGDEQKKAFALFVEETLGVTRSFKRLESPHFVVSLDDHQDGILSPYLLDGMERTYDIIAKRYGFEPKERIRIEVFPDAKSFYYASTLSIRDIEVTGAVGLAKFNKLMLLSPRALVHGYRWLDAISHEYMHYVILKMSADRAPIWFHEGLAKFEETRWRNGPSYLSPSYQGLLSRALAENRLIRFEKMEPSLIALETPEEVQLAYAQAASAIDFIVVTRGFDSIKQIMLRMAAHDEKGAGDTIKEVLGLSFDEFEKAWKAFLSDKNLKTMEGVHGHRYKVKEGKPDDERLDMEEIRSMVARNRAHLGDLLKERGRPEAAVLEYRRALAESSDSLAILNRLSSVLIDLGKYGEALDLLKRANALSPDHPTVYTSLGKASLRLNAFQEAREHFEASVQINPFNPEVHRGLADAAERLGDKATAVREREIAKRLGR